MKKFLPPFILLFFITLAMPCAAQDTPDIDPRIKLHFPDTQIQEMLSATPLKIEVLNTYYRSSYVLIAPANLAACDKVDPATVDVTSYEHLRLTNERARVGYTRTGYVLELLSQQELQALYDKLGK